MPCSDHGIEEYYANLPKRVHELTRLLCEACRNMDLYGCPAANSVELTTWWHKHKREDAHK